VKKLLECSVTIGNYRETTGCQFITDVIN